MANQDSFAMITGRRAHQIVALAAAQGLPEDRSLVTLQLAEIGQRLYTDHPVAVRGRESLFQAVTAAGVYVWRFLPRSPDWRFAGAEVNAGNSRLDLAFESSTGVLVDELKLGIGRYGELRVREQIDRYLRDGAHRWGDRFLGVRLCCVHEPAKSRYFKPRSARSTAFATSPLAGNLEIR